MANLEGGPGWRGPFDAPRVAVAAGLSRVREGCQTTRRNDSESRCRNEFFDTFSGPRATLLAPAAALLGPSAPSLTLHMASLPPILRTDLGGPDARLSMEESVPSLVNVLVSKLGTPGLQYLDYLGRTVPW